MNYKTLRQLFGNTKVFQWKQPCNGNVKLNFNAAMFTKEKTTGIETIIRDSRGQTIAAMSKRALGIMNEHPFQITINIKNLVSCHVSKQC